MSDTELLEFLRHLLDPAAFQKAELMLKMITDGGSTAEPGGAQDQAMAYDMASTSPGKIVANREVAISEVEAIVGRHTVLACDSAASVFQAALKHMGVSTTGVHVSALPAILRAHRDRMRHGASGGDPRPYVAQDARGAADFDRRFPDIARIGTAY